MTKHLNCQEVAMYIEMLHLAFADGRAAGAAKLHALNDIASEIPADDNKDNSNHNKPQRRHPGNQLVEMDGQRRDGWDSRGQGGLWRRRHDNWRYELFTPTRTPRGPSRGTQIARCRRTEGIYDDGTTFILVDDWCSPSRAHLSLMRRWRGTTSFVGCPDSKSTSFV